MQQPPLVHNVMGSRKYTLCVTHAFDACTNPTRERRRGSWNDMDAVIPPPVLVGDACDMVMGKDASDSDDGSFENALLSSEMMMMLMMMVMMVMIMHTKFR